jgi:hypothetical protein
MSTQTIADNSYLYIVERPCLGARIMVTSVAAILLHAISMDIECWTMGTKELAARFLLTLLLFVESNITMHLQPLLKIMHKGVAEQPGILIIITVLLSLTSESEGDCSCSQQSSM